MTTYRDAAARPSSALLLALALSGLIAASGCTEPEPSSPDASTAACDDGRVETDAGDCLKACSDQSDCAADEECREAGADSKVCAPTSGPMDAGGDTGEDTGGDTEDDTGSDTGDDTGSDTTTDADACGPDQIASSTEGCLTICSAEADCPDEERKCLEVGLAEKVCWEVAGADKECSEGKRPLVHGTCVNKCSSDDDCMADNDCRKYGADSGICMLWESPDAGMPDTGTPDTGATDTGTTDSGMADSGMADTNSADVNMCIETANNGCLTKCSTDNDCNPGETCRNVGLSSNVCWPTGDTGT